MPKLIIGLVGLQGCGKGTVADLLRTEYHAGYYRFSGVIGDILQRLALEKSRENFIKASEALRGTFGEDIFSYTIEKEALSSPEEIVVIDGIRRPEDIVGLEPLPNFVLISIEVEAELRYERMKKRGEKATESTMTWEQFQADEHAPTERAIPFVMSRATHRLSNNTTRESFEIAVRALLKELLSSV